MKGRLRRWLNQALTVLAIAYPAALFAAWVLLRFIGERWWLTSVVLYLPPLAFGLPLPLLALGLALARRRRLLLLQVLSLLLLLFPLMGLTLPSLTLGTRPSKTLRIVSYNVNSGRGGFDALKQEIARQRPDLVFIEELPDYNGARMEAELGAFPHIRRSNDFLVASKYPITEYVIPERLLFYGDLRSPRFVKVVVDSPLGKVTFFDVHTVSPRGGIYALRGRGLRREIASGRLLVGANAGELLLLSQLRELQVSTFAAAAAREAGPVIIVGDTNLPRMSPVRHKYLAGFQDGFEQAGHGFGYTYPDARPWMRIDLVLASEHFHFVDFQVGDGQASDHRCISAELGLATK